MHAGHARPFPASDRPLAMVQRVSAAEYERRIRAASDDGLPAPAIAPPNDYTMSSDFRAWLVGRMRADGGLDRMAVLTAPRDPGRAARSAVVDEKEPGEPEK